MAPPLRRISQFDIHVQYALPPPAFGITKYDTLRALPSSIAARLDTSDKSNAATRSKYRPPKPQFQTIRTREATPNPKSTLHHPTDSISSESDEPGQDNASSTLSEPSEPSETSDSGDSRRNTAAVVRMKASTHPSARLGTPIKYYWSSTTGLNRLPNPTAPASMYDVGDIFLHTTTTSADFQLWVCEQASGRGRKREWVIATVDKTPYPKEGIPLILSYAAKSCRPKWVLKESIETAARKGKGRAP